MHWPLTVLFVGARCGWSKCGDAVRPEESNSSAGVARWNCPVLDSCFTDRRWVASLGSMSKWPPCKVLVNELKKLPHYEGQLVLHAIAPDREIKIKVQQGRYWVHCGVTSGTVEWTRLMAGRDTIEAARGTALWILREPI